MFSISRTKMPLALQVSPDPMANCLDQPFKGPSVRWPQVSEDRMASVDNVHTALKEHVEVNVSCEVLRYVE